MSVYTEVSREQLVAFLSDYSVGELVSFDGISDGIENTNYFVSTDQGQFVLTLFEQHDFDELGYFLDVMTFFYKNDIPSAHPAADKNGDYLKTLCGRPAALVMRLSGRGVNDVASNKQCQAIGDVLGKCTKSVSHLRSIVQHSAALTGVMRVQQNYYHYSIMSKPIY